MTYSLTLQVAGTDYVIQSLRHSMRDRLRAVGCPSDMIDEIGGWFSGKVGEGYVEGFKMSQLHAHLLMTDAFPTVFELS